jgi:drug/metabolite transporter (DMT)-like permease
MLLVVAVWGSTFVVVKGALADATPGAFNLVRMTLAFAVLAGVYHRSWREMRAWQVASGAVVGLCLGVAYQFQTIGLTLTTPSKSAFITGLLVVMVPLLSAIPGLRPRGAQRPHAIAYVSAAMALVGIVLLTAPAMAPATEPSTLLGTATHWLPDLNSINRGDLLSLGCALAFSFHCIALSHTSPRIGFRPLAILQVGFCALFMAVSLPFIEQPQIHWTPRLGMALAIVAVLATAAAFSVQSWAQSVLPSAHMALLLTMEPVFAWITSFVVMGERLGLRAAMGALLILAGILLTELVPPPHVPTAHEA